LVWIGYTNVGQGSGRKIANANTKLIGIGTRKILRKSITGDAPAHVLNLGSSTLEFRTIQSPFINKDIFAHLEKKGVKITHSDIKAGPGIDLVADVTSDEGTKKLMSSGANVILVSNLLEHVEDLNSVIYNLTSLVPQRGSLLITGPYLFPHHPDPIDNGWRPSLEEVSALFPDFKVVTARYTFGWASGYGMRTSPSKVRQVLSGLLIAFSALITGAPLPQQRFAAWCLHLSRISA
jgi:hypothetical protein